MKRLRLPLDRIWSSSHPVTTYPSFEKVLRLSKRRQHLCALSKRMGITRSWGSVSLQGLQVSESMYRALPLWGHSLVETEKGALIWLGSKADTRLLVFEFDAFNPEISTFALAVPDGPQFIYQCLVWFEAGTAPLQPLQSQEAGTRHAFRTGEPVRVALTREGRTLHVQKPDETTVKLENSMFTETDQIGVYTLFADDRRLERFTVNLLNATESALSHSSTVSVTEVPLEVGGGLQPMTQEIWRWFATWGTPAPRVGVVVLSSE